MVQKQQYVALAKEIQKHNDGTALSESEIIDTIKLLDLYSDLIVNNLKKQQ